MPLIKYHRENIIYIIQQPNIQYSTIQYLWVTTTELYLEKLIYFTFSFKRK